MAENIETIRVIDFVDGTSVDGPGLRTAVYLAGCSHRCPGCHNPSTWDFKAGKDMSIDEILSHIDENDFNVTLTGGDPMYQARQLLPLLKRLKADKRNIWLYTGFTFEDMISDQTAYGSDMRELLDYIDVLVDGPFIEALKNPDLRFRGSSNQRLIDVRATLSSGTVIIYGGV